MNKFIVLALLIAGVVQTAHCQEKVVVHKFAEFPDGGDKFFEYIKKEIQYPADAKKDSLTGHVYVEFTVAATGEIQPESIKVVKGLSPSCDAEALRVIKKAPKWTPGATRTAPIEQRITFPISFVYK